MPLFLTKSHQYLLTPTSTSPMPPLSYMGEASYIFKYNHTFFILCMLVWIIITFHSPQMGKRALVNDVKKSYYMKILTYHQKSPQKSLGAISLLLCNFLRFNVDFYNLFQQTINFKYVPIVVGTEFHEMDGCFHIFDLNSHCPFPKLHFSFLVRKPRDLVLKFYFDLCISPLLRIW